MRIIVCVKQVPDTYEVRSIGPDYRVVRTDGAQVCDELTERVISLAASIRAAKDEIISLTMGPEKARGAIRHSLAMGADRGIHICDQNLAGADQVLTASVLASAIRRTVPWDLVLLGTTSSDGAGGVIPALLAELLQVPLLADLACLQLEGEMVAGKRQTGQGMVGVEARMPAVVSFTDELPEAELPGLRSVLGAKRKPIEVLGLRELDAGVLASRTEVIAARQQPRRSAGVKLIDDGTGAAQLADFLVSRRLV